MPRRALPADLQDLVTLCQHRPCWQPAAVAAALDDAAHQVWLAEQGGSLAGALWATVCGDCFDVLDLFVEEHARRAGLATKLLRALQQAANAAQAAGISLEVAADNLAALRLYRGLHFVQAGSRVGYYRRSEGDCVDAWVLSWSTAAKAPR